MEARELKEIREGMGFNRREMARRLKTPPSTYGKWEQGTRRIPGLLEVALAGIQFMEANKTSRG